MDAPFQSRRGVMRDTGSAGSHSTSPLCGRLPILAVVALLSCGPPAVAAGPDAPKLVVVVYPDESDGAPGMVLVNRAIRSVFATESPVRIEVRNEYVDTTRLRD